MYEDKIQIAKELADIAGRNIMRYFRKKDLFDTIETKGDTSPVTIADRTTEAAMREVIHSEFPNHGIVGEEYGIENPDAEYVWVLDPIDGTKSFITGSPLFGTLIALLHHNVPVVGIIDQPVLKERWLGVLDRHTLYNGKPCETRSCEALEKAALYSTGGRLMFKDASDADRFDKLNKKVSVSRFSADCYAYGLLSMGCIDVIAEANMKLYDYAALVPIVEGAGGAITDWEGKQLTRNSDGHVLAVGDKSMLNKVVEALR
ncbi:MAG: histidinol-phosphatase [Alphaproteobacteria bacterium]|nr:histidinol-phosphatase [Alphaproteobacteria bacterium]